MDVMRCYSSRLRRRAWQLAANTTTSSRVRTDSAGAHRTPLVRAHQKARRSLILRAMANMSTCFVAGRTGLQPAHCRSPTAVFWCRCLIATTNQCRYAFDSLRRFRTRPRHSCERQGVANVGSSILNDAPGQVAPGWWPMSGVRPAGPTNLDRLDPSGHLVHSSRLHPPHLHAWPSRVERSKGESDLIR